MPVPPPSLSHSAIVGRLRAVGCVFAEDEADLLLSSAASPTELAAMVDRRVEGLPLEQVVGWVEFVGLRIAVAPGVFVPRRRTGLLVREAAALVRPGSVVVDLCCGCGAVGIAIAAAVPGIELHAADVEPRAVRCARRNIPDDLGSVHEGDLYDALPTALRGRVDVLAVNAPYVPTDAIGMMPPEARDHEPAVALDGGADGLDVQRRVAADAATWLVPGGHLLIETSIGQADRTAAAFAANGLTPTVVHSDEWDGTVVTGRAATGDR
jgi:release factor glutamine methyltransferase